MLYLLFLAKWHVYTANTFLQWNLTWDVALCLYMPCSHWIGLGLYNAILYPSNNLNRVWKDLFKEKLYTLSCKIGFRKSEFQSGSPVQWSDMSFKWFFTWHYTFTMQVWPVFFPALQNLLMLLSVNHEPW